MTRPITQEIPIDLKLAEDIALAEPPQLPRPEVNVYLPPIRTLKTIIDKMKAMGLAAPAPRPHSRRTGTGW